MKSEWKDTFQRWAKPPGETERLKCERAVKAIRDAIADAEVFESRNVSVFPQGSYRNRTNVRADSDVDICIFCSDTFYYDLPKGFMPRQFGISGPASYTYAQFKDDVGTALTEFFGLMLLPLARRRSTFTRILTELMPTQLHALRADFIGQMENSSLELHSCPTVAGE